MNGNPNSSYPQDEIDVRELLSTLIKRKMIIFTIVVISSLIATTFAWTTTPIYNGSVLLEVGEVINNHQSVNNQLTTIYSLDDTHNLKEISAQATEVTVNIPSGTNNILKLSYESSDPSKIKTKLDNAVNFIIVRHREKAKLYQNGNSKIRMTQIISKIHIESDPVKPKKKLIISLGFIGGLIAGIFLAFFLEFIEIKRSRYYKLF